MEKIRIVYYSGTGGTRMAAECFADILQKQGFMVTMQRLMVGEPEILGELQRLVLMFPVYAFNAPEPVLAWADNIAAQPGVRAAVISVSGGGEMCPNTACRRKTIKSLERKGFLVDYENMLVMPPNIAIAIKEPLDKMLLDILPQKVEAIVDQLQQDVIRRKKPLLLDRFLASMGILERLGAHVFGKRIRVLEQCNGCSHCAKNCPSGNITMKEGRPTFGKVCHLCLNCFYSCPKSALVPGIAKAAVLKDGYDLDALAKKPRQESLTPEQIKTLAPGVAWSGVRKYRTTDS
jgi:flavodoxin/Pyruvate/2-oxoacid:ferredoxin oxidoreductase delta subunit